MASKSSGSVGAHCSQQEAAHDSAIILFLPPRSPPDAFRPTVNMMSYYFENFIFKQLPVYIVGSRSVTFVSVCCY